MNAIKMMLGLTAAMTLGSCTMMNKPLSYIFKHKAVDADPAAAGVASVSLGNAGMSTTTLTLSGLTPGKAYISHYHAFGSASSSDPCASNGPVTVGFPNFTADSIGMATTVLSTDMAKIAGDAGAYINVHYASDPSIIPICAPVKLVKG